MEDKCLYIRSRGESDSRIYVEVKVVETGVDEITILVADKTMAKRSHTELYHQGNDGNFVRQLFQIIKHKKSREGILLRLTQVSATKPAEVKVNELRREFEEFCAERDLDGKMVAGTMG